MRGERRKRENNRDFKTAQDYTGKLKRNLKPLGRVRGSEPHSTEELQILLRKKFLLILKQMPLTPI